MESQDRKRNAGIASETVDMLTRWVSPRVMRVELMSLCGRLELKHNHENTHTQTHTQEVNKRYNTPPPPISFSITHSHTLSSVHSLFGEGRIGIMMNGCTWNVNGTTRPSCPCPSVDIQSRLCLLHSQLYFSFFSSFLSPFLPPFTLLFARSVYLYTSALSVNVRSVYTRAVYMFIACSVHSMTIN